MEINPFSFGRTSSQRSRVHMALRTSSTKNNNGNNKMLIMTIILRIIITIMITNIEIKTMIIAIIIRVFKCKCLDCWNLKETKNQIS